MKYRSILILALLSFIIHGNFNAAEEMVVTNSDELNSAIENAQPGDEIILADGVWNDISIIFYGHGTKDKPIILRAETHGKVFIEGKSNLKLGGEYLIVNGLYFRNGSTPDNTVIEFKIDNEKIANHCRVTNSVIEEFVQPNRYDADHWVEFWGRHNQLDHCYIAGKFNQGPTIRIYLDGNENIRNYHKIINNHFGPRPRKGGPKAETMQIGDSGTSMVPSYVLVADNFFERCNGEVEIISSKSNFNEFRNNVFYESEGSLVTRHGNYCIIDGNFFIGNETSDFIGGIRIINTGHVVTNNYFYKLKADEFRAPLAIMNGIPKSPLNRYNQVTDVVVAYNSWVDCSSPWHLSVGANIDNVDVLPKSEIRSARPERTILANNLIFNHTTDEKPIIAYDKVDGIDFLNNVIDNQNNEFEHEGIKQVDLEMKKISDWLYVPEEGQKELSNLYNGFGFENITEDIFGNSRKENNSVGAVAGSVDKNQLRINANNYGAAWFTPVKENINPTIIKVKTGDELEEIVQSAQPGHILELSEGTYTLDNSLTIDKRIIIKTTDKDDNVKLIYSGTENTPLFEMNPRGNLSLTGITIEGNGFNSAFAPLEKNMSLPYKINVNNCRVNNFDYILKSYKGSMADSIYFDRVTFKDCKNGIVLDSETDDKGDYNAEFVTIKNCGFENVRQNVINFYRGGYDESTIGGSLTVTNSFFKECGQEERSNILLKTRGIINVDISDNVFENNYVKLIAILWGEKNNSHSGNKITGDAKIRVDEFLKQKLVY